MSVSHWRTAAMVAAAVVAGAIVGPPLAQAAATATGLVRLAGGGSSHLAKVSASGQLSVNPGLEQTAAHQILAVQASPSSFVTAIGGLTPPPNCSKGGFYQIPKGHAFILTGADFFNLASSTAPPERLLIADGPSDAPCSNVIAESSSEEGQATANQVFQPGIAIPAGDALGLGANADLGGVIIYGYLVPASEVPPHAATAGASVKSLLRLLGR